MQYMLTCPSCMYCSCASKRSCRVLIQGLGSRRSQACGRRVQRRQGGETQTQEAKQCGLSAC
jgi:hypothetical protein